MKYIVTFLCVVYLSVTNVTAQSNLITKIPFTIEGNHLFIEVSVNGSQKLDFVFDTGAGGTAINTKTTENLNLTGGKEITSKGAGGEISLQLIPKTTLDINGLKLHKVSLQNAPLLHLEKVIGKDIDGIIGYEILKKHVVKINYNTSEIEVYESKGFKYTGNGQPIKIDIGDVSTMIAQIDLEGGNSLDGEFIIDNGAGLAIAFCTPFSKKNQLKSKLGKTYPIESKGFSSNTSTVNVGRLKRLKIKDFEFPDVPASLYNVKSGVFAYEGIAGVIGNEILKRFNITFDYKRKKTYWEPNEVFNKEEFVVPCSGLRLSLDSTKTRVFIENIIAKSAATTSDLKVGDEIIEIDGVEAKSSSLGELRKLLRQDGKQIEVKCNREGTMISTTIDLKALI